MARNQFAKAARAPVSAPPDLVEQVGRLLSRRCLDLLGLARRAGELVVGFEQVADWLRQRPLRPGAGGRDGSADGRRRIEALAGDVPVLDPFARAELGRAVGRDEVVHVGRRRVGLGQASCATSWVGCTAFESSAMPAGHRCPQRRR